MKTLTEVLKDIRDKADRDIAEANLRYTMYDHILTMDVDGFCIPRIHIHRLWGTIAAVRWEAGHGDGALLPPTRYLLKTLLETYKPEPLVRVENGAVSFRPDLGPEAEQWRGEITPVHPVTVTVESLPITGRITREVRVCFQWNAMLGGSLIRLAVVFPGDRVNFNMFDGARVTRWTDTPTETFWWEIGKRVPSFPALIIERDQSFDSILDKLTTP